MSPQESSGDTSPTRTDQDLLQNPHDEPILLIHGDEDNNSGTFPMQSKRLYQAIEGTGGTVRLVMLPERATATARENRCFTCRPR